jgi:hypothetical protein
VRNKCRFVNGDEMESNQLVNVTHYNLRFSQLGSCHFKSSECDLEPEGNSSFETSGDTGPRAQCHIPEDIMFYLYLFERDNFSLCFWNIFFFYR